MKLKDIAAARIQAEAFIDAASNAMKRAAEQQREAQERLGHDNYTQREIDACKQSGALRRASMDLTRALAVMRGREK